MKTMLYGGVGIEVAREIEIKNDIGTVLHKKDIGAPLFEGTDIFLTRINVINCRCRIPANIKAFQLFSPNYPQPS